MALACTRGSLWVKRAVTDFCNDSFQRSFGIRRPTRLTVADKDFVLKRPSASPVKNVFKVNWASRGLKIEINPPPIWFSLVGLLLGLIAWVGQNPKALELFYDLSKNSCDISF